MLNYIVEELCNEGVIEELCTNMGVNPLYKDDLVQEIYMILLEYREDKIVEMYEKKQLKFFIVRIIQNQYNSCNSPFFKKYKKYYTIIDGNTINNDEMEEDYDKDFD